MKKTLAFAALCFIGLACKQQEKKQIASPPGYDLSVPEKNLGESEFCKWLTKEIGVAAIPMSAFYGNGFDQNVIRFCFAKRDATLNTAIERLARL